MGDSYCLSRNSKLFLNWRETFHLFSLETLESCTLRITLEGRYLCQNSPSPHPLHTEVFTVHAVKDNRALKYLNVEVFFSCDGTIPICDIRHNPELCKTHRTVYEQHKAILGLSFCWTNKKREREKYIKHTYRNSKSYVGESFILKIFHWVKNCPDLLRQVHKLFVYKFTIV